jgi:predicted thioesterase
MTIEKGLKGSYERVAGETDSADRFGNKGFHVYGTPALVALIEYACGQTVAPHLPKGSGTVGTIVNIKHLAPTPLGMKIRAEAEVVEVDGRRFVFHVEAFDEKEKIAEGEHERYVVELDRFLKKVEGKKT